jgi:hypothetical protein
MSVIAYVIIASAALVALVVYQLVKGKKPVTVAAVKAQVSADAAAVKTDVSAVKADAKKL